MSLTEGIHHITFLTSDVDRLIAFNARVFEAHETLDFDEEGLRDAFIAFGPATVLHPFQVPDVDVPQRGLPMFARVRLDHPALNATIESAFRELRRRIQAEGATDGNVIDMGSLLNVGFVDPDGGSHEVVWVTHGVPSEQRIRRADWTIVTCPDETVLAT